jgi:hypothetical protein
MKKKPTTYKVPMSWVRMFPRHGLHHVFWIAVSRRVRERGIAHKDLLRVRRVCLEVGRVLGL